MSNTQDTLFMEGAAENPYQPYLQYNADMVKNFGAHEFRAFGKHVWISISKESQERIGQELIKIQHACQPTIRKLRNVRNVAQLQEKVYLGLKKYE
jgi:uncharacterized protein (DUF1697 family)